MISIGFVEKSSRQYLSKPTLPSQDKLIYGRVRRTSSIASDNTSLISQDTSGDVLTGPGQITPFSSAEDYVALQAAEMVRSTFNRHRLADCSSLPAYNQPGAIQYTIKWTDSKGRVIYSMEILFGEEVVFAQVVLLSNNSGVQLLSSTPEPCITGIEDQLAITFQGADAHNFIS